LHHHYGVFIGLSLTLTLITTFYLLSFKKLDKFFKCKISIIFILQELLCNLGWSHLCLLKALDLSIEVVLITRDFQVI
ncbi:LOW QUALITY PROTEIN: hypothetical protein TorRG33x02_047560, partial [Trema orientale]